MAGTEFIGFNLCNLIIPDDPVKICINTASGVWTFDQIQQFDNNKAAIISNGMCANTYSAGIEVSVNTSISSAVDAAFEELLPICLGLSYLSGLAVAPTQALPHSFVSFVQVGDHFPRQRSMGSGNQIACNNLEFQNKLELFVGNYSAINTTEKISLLIHHWLDSLACWSLEDMTLGVATLLEIIAATANDRAILNNQNLRNFSDRINAAACHYNLPTLGRDFRDMRNDLVHEGSLSASRFSQKNLDDCTNAAIEALNWIDSYIHSAIRLYPPSKQRFQLCSFKGINSFSLT